MIGDEGGPVPGNRRNRDPRRRENIDGSMRQRIVMLVYYLSEPAAIRDEPVPIEA